MKIIKVIKPSVPEEIEVTLPCYRKRKMRIAKITETGHIEIYLDGSGYYDFILSGYDFFAEGSSEATEQEFQEALNRHIEYVKTH